MNRFVSAKYVKAAGVAVVVAAAGSVANAELIYGVTQEQTLITFNSSAPETILSGRAISGMQPNEIVRGIDIRPATGELFALGSFGRLYTINPNTGVATQSGDPLNPGLNGSSFGFDFNPTVDRIRIVSDVNQNLRVNPTTGGTIVDGTLAYVGGDPNENASANIVAAAYTNSFAGSTSTMLYVLDTGLDTLVLQNPANSGNLITVGPLGVDLTDTASFDISGVSGVAFASVQNAQLSRTTFWTIDLNTGAASPLGEVGGGSLLTAMTVVPAPGAAALLGLAGAALLRRRR